jgi:hypothetical protein
VRVLKRVQSILNTCHGADCGCALLALDEPNHATLLVATGIWKKIVHTFTLSRVSTLRGIRASKCCLMLYCMQRARAPDPFSLVT